MMYLQQQLTINQGVLIEYIYKTFQLKIHIVIILIYSVTVDCYISTLNMAFYIYQHLCFNRYKVARITIHSYLYPYFRKRFKKKKKSFVKTKSFLMSTNLKVFI